MIINKHKKVCTTLNYIEHLLILASAVTVSVFISAFAFLVGISTSIASSAVGLNILAITVEIKMSKSIIKKKRKTHHEIVLLAKTKLNSIEVLISNLIEDSRYIYQNQLDKACFQHDIIYGGGSKDIPRRTAFDKVLHDKELFNNS